MALDVNIVVTIEAVDRSTYIYADDGGLTIERQTMGRSTLNARVRDLGTGSFYRPSVGDSITVEDSGGAIATLFAGYITDVREESEHAYRGLNCYITAADNNAYPDRRIVTATFEGYTLKQILQALCDNFFDVFGITLAGAQANGPTIPVITWQGKSGGACLNDLTNLSGWIWTVDSGLNLRMIAPGGSTAPWSLTEANPHRAIDIILSHSTGNYVNRQYVRFGSDAAIRKTEVFTANGVLRTWTTQLPAATGSGIGGYITLGTNNYRPVGVYGVDDIEWTWDEATHTLHHDTDFTVIANGVLITVNYTAQFPVTIYDENATEISTYGLFESMAEYSDVFDYDTALSLAQGLRARKALRSELSYRTVETGLWPDQLQTVNLPDRGISSVEFIIQSVSISSISPRQVYSQVSALEGDTLGGDYLDLYRYWGGDISGGSTAGASTAGSTTMTGPFQEFAGGSRTNGIETASVVSPLWFDDFESGTALSADYTLDGTPTKSTAAEKNGVQGLLTTNEYDGLIRVNGTQTLPGMTSVWAQHRHASSFGYSILEVRRVSYIISIYVYANGKVEIWSTGGLVLASATGVWPASTWKFIRLEWNVTDSAAPTNESYMRVYLGDTTNPPLLLDTGLIDDFVSTGAEWNRVFLSPKGDADDWTIQAGLGEWLDVADFLNLRLDSANFTGRTPRLAIELMGDDVADVDVRYYDADNDYVAGQLDGIAVANGVWATSIIPLTLGAGSRLYRPQIRFNTANVAVFTYARVEA